MTRPARRPTMTAGAIPAAADVVIAGGAVMGSSAACHLAAVPAFQGNVVVVEKDPTYQFSASALSAASIRQQYSSPINIQISLYGIRYLREIDERFPWLDLDGVDVGTWGRTGEGWFDGWALMQAFRKKARSLGVTYVEGEV